MFNFRRKRRTSPEPTLKPEPLPEPEVVLAEPEPEPEPVLDMELEKIPEPVKLSRQLSLLDIDKMENRIALLQKQIDRLVVKKDSLLPVENNFRWQLQATIAEFDHEKNKLIERLKYTEYDLFDINMLELRDADNMPRFAPFDIFGAEWWSAAGTFCTAEGVHRSGDKFWKSSRGKQELPSDVFKYYEDLNDVSDENNLQCHYVKFTGIIPDSVRSKLKGWKDKFKQIYLIAEVTGQWNIAKYEELPPMDPFVIGWDGYNHYLLEAFDLTPYERWLEAEMIV